MKTKIIIDSTTNIKRELAGCFGVVPLTVNFGDKEYVDGVTIDHTQFYKMLEEGGVLPTTSQPTPEAFANAFRAAVNDGYQVVAITVASKLSGTYQSACIAAEEFGDDVIVVDGGNALSHLWAVLLVHTQARVPLQWLFAQDKPLLSL